MAEVTNSIIRAGHSFRSTTAITTPTAFAATEMRAFASTVSGAVLMGYGTTGDVTLKNRAGTDVLWIGPNTTTTTLAGALVVGASAAVPLLFNGATTGASYIHLTNTGGDGVYGIMASAGVFSGASAYATIFGSNNATATELISNGNVRLSVSSAGAFDFKSNAVSGITTLATTDAITSTKSGNANFFAIISNPDTTTSNYSTQAGWRVAVAGNVIGALKATAKNLAGLSRAALFLTTEGTYDLAFGVNNSATPSMWLDGSTGAVTFNALLTATAGILISSGQELQLGRAASASIGTASTHKIQVKDSAGATYYMLVTNV